jgi:hypothetical protein
LSSVAGGAPSARSRIIPQPITATNNAPAANDGDHGWFPRFSGLADAKKSAD